MDKATNKPTLMEIYVARRRRHHRRHADRETPLMNTKQGLIYDSSVKRRKHTKEFLEDAGNDKHKKKAKNVHSKEKVTDFGQILKKYPYQDPSRVDTSAIVHFPGMIEPSNKEPIKPVEKIADDKRLPLLVQTAAGHMDDGKFEQNRQPRREFSVTTNQTRKPSKSRVTVEDSNERPEWASDPQEFTSSGTPIPFWELEMRKGPEYLMKLHRKYGNQKKHERVPAYKPDMEVISIDTRVSEDSYNQPQFMYDDGLRGLISIDRAFLLHRQAIEDAVLRCCNVVVNDYHILNAHGHQLYTIKEIRKPCRRTYVFRTPDGEATMWIKSLPVALDARRKYEIFSPEHHKIGSVVQWWSYPTKKSGFSIYDQKDMEIIQFERSSPKVKNSKHSDLIFEYKSPRGQGPLGNITVKLADLKMANFTESDYYGVKIIKELPANIKARIVAAWFIIYRIYYVGRTFIDVHHTLSEPAKRLYQVKKPSTEEIPEGFEDDIPFLADFDN